MVYGQPIVKRYKTFLATSPVGGEIRVVLVKEDRGWFAFFCSDPNAAVAEILEEFADRATIEQDFHDVNEVWGAGQQQVRNIWTNVAVFNLNPWVLAPVELWAWRRPHDQLVDRNDSPLGRRRPSPFPRQSPQSPAPLDPRSIIIRARPRIFAAEQNRNPSKKPHHNGRLTAEMFSESAVA
jgi:hypothetical protein